MNSHGIRGRLALVVPALGGAGGVPAVARFVLGVAIRSGFSVKAVSLAMSGTDSASTRLLSPSTWLKGVVEHTREWEGLPMAHVGAAWTELEFQRYMPRKALADLVSDCDIVQVIAGSAAWANPVLGLGKPVSLQVATRAKVERRFRYALASGPLGWWRRAMTEVTDRIDDRVLRAVDALQLENPWMLDYSQQINQHRKSVDIRYAPPGVDANIFCPEKRRNLINFPYILCVARLDDPRKNIGLLLDAYSRLPAGLSHINLVTAGASQPPPSYWEKVKAMGLEARVQHIARPDTAELVKLYQHATAFALSSDEEGLGVVILEAMACGVPVVATRCGGPDGIITDGKDGFLVPLDDANSMADRLACLCVDEELNRQLGREARATVEARYADHVAGAAFVDVWDKLLLRVGRR